MVPMIPDLSLDLGNQALSFVWTLDGPALIALVALFFPWLLLGLAAIANVLDASPRPTETEHGKASTTEVALPEAVLPARVPLGQAA